MFEVDPKWKSAVRDSLSNFKTPVGCVFIVSTIQLTLCNLSRHLHRHIPAYEQGLVIADRIAQM